jgi:hypothetical protein
MLMIRQAQKKKAERCIRAREKTESMTVIAACSSFLKKAPPQQIAVGFNSLRLEIGRL